MYDVILQMISSVQKKVIPIMKKNPKYSPNKRDLNLGQKYFGVSGGTQMLWLE